MKQDTSIATAAQPQRPGLLGMLSMLVSVATWTAALPASAHHSFAMYDQTKIVTLVGTVKELQWTNPHVILWVTRDAEGRAAPELWTIELPTSTGNLSRMNWTKHSLAAGDRIAVEINPLRDGKHGGSFKKATIEGSGKVLTASPNPPAADAGAPDASPSAAHANAPADSIKPGDTTSSVPVKPATVPAAPTHTGCACLGNVGDASPGATALWMLWVSGLVLRARRARR